MENTQELLKSLADKEVSRSPLSKYCLVVYPPRNAVKSAKSSDQDDLISKIKGLPGGVGVDLYVHVPYCSRACTFCNFYFLPGLKSFQEQSEEYVGAIEQEANTLGKLLRKRKIHSLYFGGGSPSLLSPKQVGRIYRAISENIGSLDNVEVSLELHPEIIRLQKEGYLENLMEIGINRVSMGAQSTNLSILRTTKRGHTEEEIYRLLESTRNLGLTRNIDLMWGFADQTLEDHQRSLETIIEAEPDTITTYFLEIRPTSPDFEKYKSIAKDKEYQRRVIQMGIQNRATLRNSGFSEKTFDYWFKGRGFEHRKRKWGGNDTVLLSLGPGTYNWIFQGETDNTVFFKPYDVTEWQELVRQGAYPTGRITVLDEEETTRRHAMFSLRQGSVSKNKIERIPELEELAKWMIKEGLLEEDINGYKLTEAGNLLNHEIATVLSSNEITDRALENMSPEELKYASFTHPKFVRGFKRVILEE